MCTAPPAARTSSQTDGTDSVSQSSCQTAAEISKNSSQTLSITQCVHQQDTTGSDCLKPPIHLALDNEARVCSYFSSNEAVLPLFPQFPHDLTPPVYDLKESILSFSLGQDSGPPQTSIASVSVKKMSDPEPLPSCRIISDPGGVTASSWPPSHQSDGTDKDTASASMPDLYICETDTRDLILCPNVAPEELKGPDCDSRILTCVCGHLGEHGCYHSSQTGATLDCESEVPHAGDACEAARLVNDAQAGVTDLTPQMRCCDNRVELWLDACQYLAGQAPDDALLKAGHSGHPDDLDFPTTDTPVSGFSPDGGEGIGCSDHDAVGRGPPVERWSSVDSWASALSDWTGIITALPEDLTAAFTEIGAEIDALTQALAEVNAHLQGEETTHQLMGVQDQPLKTQNLPDSSVLSGQSCLSVLSGQSCLPLCLQDGDGSQSVRVLCDANAPCLTHSSAPTVSPGDPVASTGGSVTESLDPAGVDLGGDEERDILIHNSEDPVILKIIEDTDLEKAPRELLNEEVRWLLMQFIGEFMTIFACHVQSSFAV